MVRGREAVKRCVGARAEHPTFAYAGGACHDARLARRIGGRTGRMG